MPGSGRGEVSCDLCIFSFHEKENITYGKGGNNLFCQFSLKNFKEVNSEAQGLLDMDREGGYDSTVTSTPSLNIKSHAGVNCSSSG